MMRRSSRRSIAHWRRTCASCFPSQGPNYSISSACASGNFCIQNAADHIRRGDADLMLAGSSDAAILPIGMAGFMAARALSRRNDDPATASRPWDLDRDGFVMGEGAGVLVLEELEHARARGATIYAEFLGGAYTCDAHHMTEPHPEGKGVLLAIETALKSSGVARERVNYVNAHGTSTPAGDLAEYRAIRKALPGENVRINSTKSMIGASRGVMWPAACDARQLGRARAHRVPLRRSPAGRCGRGGGGGHRHGAADGHGA